MICDCCGKKKKLFESYASVKTENGNLYFCVDCNDIAYKVRDDANACNRDEYDEHMKIWNKRAKKPSKSFLKWKNKFIASYEKMFNEKNLSEK